MDEEHHRPEDELSGCTEPSAAGCSWLLQKETSQRLSGEAGFCLFLTRVAAVGPSARMQGVGPGAPTAAFHIQMSSYWCDIV